MNNMYVSLDEICEIYELFTKFVFIQMEDVLNAIYIHLWTFVDPKNVQCPMNNISHNFILQH